MPDSVDVYGAVMLVGRKELTSSRRWDSSFADASRMMHSPSLPCQIPRNSVASSLASYRSLRRRPSRYAASVMASAVERRVRRSRWFSPSVMPCERMRLWVALMRQVP